MSVIFCLKGNNYFVSCYHLKIFFMWTVFKVFIVFVIILFLFYGLLFSRDVLRNLSTLVCTELSHSFQYSTVCVCTFFLIDVEFSLDYICKNETAG